jgi:hypothetical protein
MSLWKPGPMRGVMWPEARNFFIIVGFFYLEDIRRRDEPEREKSANR